jgi:hypothetical protein
VQRGGEGLILTDFPAKAGIQIQPLCVNVMRDQRRTQADETGSRLSPGKRIGEAA